MKQCAAGVGAVLVFAAFAGAQVDISQVHASSSIYTNDYVELYNRGSSPVDLSGWSVQYAPALANFWEVTALSGTIPAHSHYLVQMAGASGSAVLPTPDAVGSTFMDPAGGKVFLASTSGPLVGHCPSTDAVVDYVLWGSAACSVPTAPALDGTSADLRMNGGCIDTDNCAADFVSGTPLPRNTGVSHGCTGGPDCNGDGVDDTAELASGALTDVNGNGTADACEGAVVAECDISANVMTSAVGLSTTSWRAQGSAVEDENGRVNPSYGAARWSTGPIKAALDTRFGAGQWRVTLIYVALKQSTLGAWAAGPVQLYYTNNDSILLNPGNTGTRFGNFNTDYPDRALALAWNFAPASDGASEPHQLFVADGLNDPGAVSIESELHSNGTLTLLLYPSSPSMVATYAGYTNASLVGPTLVIFAAPASRCDSVDFNCDGDVGTDADIEAFFACLAGNCPAPPCPNSADFNRDGDVGTDADIESFFRVLAGSPC